MTDDERAADVLRILRSVRSVCRLRPGPRPKAAPGTARRPLDEVVRWERLD